MNLILRLIRLIFLPIKFVCWIVYGDRSQKMVGYAWYTEKEYKKIIELSKDELDNLIANFEKWKEKAHKNIEAMENKGWIVFKVNIESNELESWLNKQGLINISENREKYVKQRLRSFLANPFI
jgi:hypothetical protein